MILLIVPFREYCEDMHPYLPRIKVELNLPELARNSIRLDDVARMDAQVAIVRDRRQLRH